MVMARSAVLRGTRTTRDHTCTGHRHYGSSKAISPTDTLPVVFFAHIMKSGGTTIRRLVKSNVPSHLRWPDNSDRFADSGAYADMRRLRGGTHRDQGTLAYCGHFPLAARHLLEVPALTMTVLRDPVERTLSWLRQAQRRSPEHHGKPLDEIYEDPWFTPRFLGNHQTKMLSMSLEQALAPEDETQAGLWEEVTAMHADGVSHREIRRHAAERLDEPVDSSRLLWRTWDAAITRPFTANESHLADALDQLEDIDVLGVTERLDLLLREAKHRLGWQVPGEAPTANAAPDDVDPAGADLRARIARDTRLDAELHEHACSIVERRARQPTRTHVVPARPRTHRSASRSSTSAVRARASTRR
jgi:hypothetical protein